MSATALASPQTTIVVDSGMHATIQAAANSEAEVN
jgi:hypothetical protein